MKKKKSKLVAWRLSQTARDLLKNASVSSGLTKTQIVEICIAKHALEVPGLREGAKKALAAFISRELGENQQEG